MKFRPVALAVFLIAIIGLQIGGCHPDSDEASGSGSKSSGQDDPITPKAIRAHIEFLADDALEGRGTGSRGYDLAAKYVRSQLSILGIKGGVGNGEFFQTVPFVRTSVETDNAVMRIGGSELTLETDFILLDTHRERTGDISGKVVFAGYGVTAPDFDHDDYADIDVNGAIAAFMDFEAPASFPSTIRAYYSDQNVKIANAVAHGAIGVLFVRSPSMEDMFPWEFWLRELDIGWNALRWVGLDGLPGGLPDSPTVVGVLNESGSEALFSGEEHELDEIFAAVADGVPPVFMLDKVVQISYEASHRAESSANVIGMIEGGDPELKNEFVVYTAHLDHLGIGPPIDGDAIFNGALDNASGCAALIEIARAFARLDQPPSRSVLFMFVTGEEQGLLGADYFAHHPTVPIENIVANINLDEAISLAPVRSIVPYGAEHSTFGPLSRSIANQLGLIIEADPFPEEGYFVRSDQWPFVQKGIPAVLLGVGMGFEAVDDNDDPLAVFKDWVATNYHTQKDDIAQPLAYESGARLARFAFELGHRIATDPARPQWNQGDFFGTAFGVQ